MIQILKLVLKKIKIGLLILKCFLCFEIGMLRIQKKFLGLGQSYDLDRLT